MNKQKFTLNPFGQGEIKQILREGSMFNVYRAELCGQDVCLKTPKVQNHKGFSRSEYFSHYWSESFLGGLTWNPDSQEYPYTPRVKVFRWTHTPDKFLPTDTLQIASNILLIEDQIIKNTGGSWNHSTISLGAWDGFSAYHRQSKCRDQCDVEPFYVKFLPVLVMPYHAAIPFSELDRNEKRRILPRMLPALWSALCQMYHGDLSETNILIQADYSRFHLIDPGIMLVSAISDSTHPFDSHKLYTSVLTTTAINYPLLPPFDSFFVSDSQFLSQVPTLTDCLQLLIKHDGYSSQLESSNYGIFNLDARVSSNLHQPPPKRSRPLPSDLLALGIIYYRILTDEELFLGREILPNHPAWQGEMPNHGHIAPPEEGSILKTYKRIAPDLTNYIAKELDRHDLKPSERQLANALLNLQVQDQDDLVRLIR